MTDLYIEDNLNIISMQAFPFEEYAVCESSSSVATKVWDAMKLYLDKLIRMIKDAAAKIREKIQKKIREKQLSKNLALLKKKLAGKKGTTVKFYDVWTYEKVTKSAVSKLNRSLGIYMKRLDVVGAGLHATNREIDRINAIISDADKRLSEIRAKKITVPAEKALDWVDAQIKKGNTTLYAFADEYLKRVEECKKIIQSLDKRADAYAKEAGMIRRPEGFKEVFHNSTRFVVRNMDWIGSILVLSAITFVDTVTQKKASDTIINDSESKGIFSRGDSKLYNADRVNYYNAKKRKEGRSSNKRAIQAANVTGNLKTFSRDAATLSLLNSIITKRNSV